MPRARFDKLPSDQQDRILRAALEEFAAHGFNDASLNRIIDAAGISKGSMYYYFDGKEDLYAHVARVELARMLEAAGPFPIPEARTPDAYWAALEGAYHRIMVALAASPAVAELARDWLVSSTNPRIQQAQKQMEQALLPWLEQALVAGQRMRAVRQDVQLGLLVAIVFGMGQAMDAWLVAQPLQGRALRKMVRVFLGMIRKVLSPPSAKRTMRPSTTPSRRKVLSRPRLR